MPELQLRRAQKQDNRDLNAKASSFIPDQDFVPFVCNYDASTIITKNGELLQTIRIVGFNHESVSSEVVNLRETVRDAIIKHIKTEDFAIWLHTIRRKKSIAPGGKFNDYFSNALNEAWEAEKNWRNQFVNELYLTIIIQGYDTSVKNGISLLRSLSPGATKNLHERELQKAHKILNDRVQKILTDLDHYGAKLLGIGEFEGVLYSEPMRFFGKIVNLAENRYPLSANDMSEDLLSNLIAFGNRSLEVISGNDKNFATMLSVKEYREISVSVLDKFLQIPQEFIITQSIDFIDRNKALVAFDYQNYILDVSGDEQLRYLSGLESIIDSDSGEATSYGEQQITIMLINQTLDGLKKDIDSALEKLQSFGIVTVREDVFSEHCFWSQLPGNFKFLRRQKPINTSRVGGFCSLHNFPAGKRQNNHWGNAVTIFRTILDTPYFFNFHNGNNGHSMIIGPNGSGKTVLLNFLVAQSRKFENRLFYFGYNRSGNIFINALSGNYFSVSNKDDNPKALKLNPFNLEDNELNRKFLADWIRSLVSYGKDRISDEELSLIPKIVAEILSSKASNLGVAAEFFKSDATKNIYKKLAIWHSKNKFSFIFDHKEENDWSNNLINAFNLTPILEHKAVVIPIIFYLLHKIESVLDGKPTMIVLDEAWKLIDNYATGPGINDWLVRLRERNCIVIFATESVVDAAESKITGAIYKNVATQLFLPELQPSDYYKTVFGLNEQEFSLLPAMSNQDHHFLLKHDEDSVIASLDLSEIPWLLKVLSSKKETLKIMEVVMEEIGEDPKKWLPLFLEVVAENQKGVVKEKLLKQAELMHKEFGLPVDIDDKTV